MDEVGKAWEEVANSYDHQKLGVNPYAFRLGYNKYKETHPFSEEDVKWIFAKTLELAPSAESHTIMISNAEYRSHVLESLYLSIIKLWEEQKTKILYYR